MHEERPDPVFYIGTITPHEDWRGAYVFGRWEDGTPNPCNGGSLPKCSYIAWPASGMSAARGHPLDATLGSGYWMGALLSEATDGSGMQYKRNRYYDPSSGRFTQVDPAGLGGGLNAYGFGGGDAVNYGDPFGLMACCNLLQGAEGIAEGAGAAAGAASIVAAFVASHSQEIANAISSASDALREKVEVKFVTYTRTNIATGQVYSGRTSGVGDPQAIVSARSNGHPERLAGFGSAVIDRWAVGVKGYAAIRGREQQLIDLHGGAQSDGGIIRELDSRHLETQPLGRNVSGRRDSDVRAYSVDFETCLPSLWTKRSLGGCVRSSR